MPDDGRCPAVAPAPGNRVGRCLRDSGSRHGVGHIAFGGIYQGKHLVAYWVNEWS